MKEESLQFLKSVGKHIFWILFDGTLIWYLWPIVVPGIIPWRVAGGSLMAQIYWIDGVGLVLFLDILLGRMSGRHNNG